MRRPAKPRFLLWGALAEAEARRLFLQICDAIDYLAVVGLLLLLAPTQPQKREPGLNLRVLCRRFKRFP